MGTATAQARRALGQRGGDLARVWPSAVAGAALLSCLGWLAWQAGGYFGPDYLLAGAIVFATGGLILLLHVPRHRLSAPALVGFGALAAYAAWSGLSATWSPSPDAALETFQRNLVHTGIFGLALIAAGSGRYARQLVWAVFALLCVVAGAGLISRLYPEVITETLVLGGGTPYRLAYPWTYWNAAGAFAAVGFVLAAGLAADPRAVVPLRAVAAGAAVPLFVTMYLSFSRGAWLALIVGVVVLVLLGAYRGSLLLTAAIVGGAVTLAILRLRGYPALTVDPSLGSGQASAGQAYGPQLLLLAAAAASAQALIAAGRRSEAVMSELRRLGRPAGIATLVLFAVFALVAYGLRGASVEGHVTEAADATADWTNHQWQDFLRPTAPAGPASGTARLTSARGTRAELYRIAFDAFEDHPLVGEGAGSFEARFTRDRRVNEDVRNAHSLELETLGELGAVGALLLLAFVGSLVAAAVRARRRPGGLPRAQGAAVGAACAVWLAHSAVDWDWQMSSLTGTFLALAATLYPSGRRRARRRSLSGGDVSMR